LAKPVSKLTVRLVIPLFAIVLVIVVLTIVVLAIVVPLFCVLGSVASYRRARRCRCHVVTI
jgi:hypothetical protein